MSEKTKKSIGLLIYTWCIYNLYIFIAGPIAMCTNYGGIWFRFYFRDIFLLGYTIDIFRKNGLNIFMAILSILTLLGYLTLTIFPQFVVSWKKQSLFRAWIISMTGLLIGSGLYLFGIAGASKFPNIGLEVLALLCLFYYGLHLGNKMLNKTEGGHESARRIKYLLTKPCMRI